MYITHLTSSASNLSLLPYNIFLRIGITGVPLTEKDRKTDAFPTYNIPTPLNSHYEYIISNICKAHSSAVKTKVSIVKLYPSFGNRYSIDASAEPKHLLLRSTSLCFSTSNGQVTCTKNNSLVVSFSFN